MNERFPVRVLDRRSYIDTITLLLPRPIPPDAYSEFRCEAGDRFITKRAMHRDGVHWTELLTIQQPTKRELEWLHAYEAASPGAGTAWRPFFLVRVDVSLDLIVENSRAAAIATRYLQRHILPVGRFRDRWDFDPLAGRTARKKSRVRNEPDAEEGESSKDFRYGILGFRRDEGVRMSVYGDLESKTEAGSHCAHVECRLFGKRALQALKMREVQQVLLLNHRSFWRKALIMVEPPSELRLGSVIRKQRAKKSVNTGDSDNPHTGPSYTPERTAHIVLRGEWDKDALPISHNLLVMMRERRSMFGTRPQRLFTAKDTSRLIPTSSRNAKWDVQGEPGDPQG
jgi:hypothetical protein